MGEPFISIVMSVYNNEKLLPNAINSILKQTFSDWELILIDDGSTDNTAQVADGFAAMDQRIRVIHQENHGIFKSYNIGYAAAEGTYALIVNSDDTINTDSLKEIHDLAIVDNADIVMFNLSINLCDKNQKILVPDLYGYKGLLENSFLCHNCEEVRRSWAYFLERKLLNHQCAYRKGIYKTYMYENRYYGDDALYNLRIADAITCAAGTSYVVYNWFLYGRDSMNASSGKYYGYEHEMFNAFFTGHRDLFARWGITDTKAMEVLEKERLSRLTSEIRSYFSPQCLLTTEDKIKKILEDASDEIVYDCAVSSRRVEEWESRILSGLRELFIKEPLGPESSYYFLYELLDSLLCYEKDEEDIQKIWAAVYHERNPKHIGLSFLRKLRAE